MNSRSHFARGSGCFECTSCGRKTRDTGVQSIGAEVCADCYELAGMDNACNDNGTTPEQEGYTGEIAARLKNIESKGGNVQSVKDSCSFLFRVVPKVQLLNADGPARALVVNALREKAQGDRRAADNIAADFENTDHDKSTMVTLNTQADLAERLADVLEVPE